MACARLRLASAPVPKESSARAKDTTVAFKSPLLASTIPLMLIPNPASISDAFSVGLINEARPDFNALAPSDAFIPPSRIAVKKNARSFTSPPNCLTIGPAFGMAIVKSSIDTTVWFSTAFRKSICPAKSSAAIPKAFVKEIVVSRACCCSTPPSTASLVASLTCASKSAPTLPMAAASAAIFIVSTAVSPNLVNSCAIL